MSRTRVYIDQDGNTREEALPGAPTYSSSDYEATGVTVRTGLHGRNVQSAEGLADTDLIEIEGMELQVKHARELGLLGQVFDESLSVGAAAQAAREHAERFAETKEVSSYDHEGLDTATADLNARIEDGSMEHSEAEAYHTVLGGVALANMTFEEAAETAQGLHDGTVDIVELGSEKKALIESVESKVRATAEASAVSEIGNEGVARIAQIAQTDPEFAGIVRQYGMLRAQGKADVSWTEFLEDAERWVAGDR